MSLMPMSFLLVGTRLIGSTNTAKIVNGAFLVVTELLGESVCLRDEDMGESFEVTILQQAAHTRLRWALTLCSVQGRSLSGTVGIHDSHSVYFSDTHLYVALSRATDGANVFMIPQ